MEEMTDKSEYNDLLTKLECYCKEDYVPMHMPGSKRNTELFYMENPYGLDITEIDGFDNLHHAKEIIADSMKRAAELFGADETLYLVNGSSAGILAAICGATARGDQIIVARNCHISVYNAISINGLKPYYLQPECDVNTGIYKGITLQDIKKCFREKRKQEDKKTEVKAVVLTSPTYEGYVSEVKEIADYLHQKGIIFIVDEAHGAHFQMSEAFPQSAVELGADAVIQSIHKTLPAFTQTALLHLNGRWIDRRRVKMYWNIYQTTSPSYILMAGIDRCISILKERKNELFESYLNSLQNLRERLSHLKSIRLLETDDISKLVLVVPKITDGKQFYDQLLRDYHIQLEMSSLRYVIAMTSIGDQQENYDRFANAIELMDDQLMISMKDNQISEWNTTTKKNNDKSVYEVYDCSRLQIEVVMTPAKAVERLSDQAQLFEMNEAVGEISGTQICMYPPGIPLINLGERITRETIDILNKGISAGLEVMGLEEGKILCLK